MLLLGQFVKGEKQQVKEKIKTYIQDKISSRVPIQNVRDIYEAVNVKLGTYLQAMNLSHVSL